MTAFRMYLSGLLLSIKRTLYNASLIPALGRSFRFLVVHVDVSSVSHLPYSG
jgi:hypothetical protein